MKIDTWRFRILAAAVAAAATAFLFLGVPSAVAQVAAWFSALFDPWFSQLSSHQQHLATVIGRIISYALPIVVFCLAALLANFRRRRIAAGSGASKAG
jgi:hypothetical protein